MATLIQFLVIQKYFGREFYKNESLCFSRSTYYSCQKDCRAVGVLYLFDTTKTKIQIGDIPY